MAQVKVRYKGIADERIISVADLKDSPANIDKDLVWNRANLFTLIIDASDELIEVLRAQEHFTISAVKEEGSAGEPDVIATATNPDNPGDVVVDGNTGAKSAAKK